jgi:hypothetical protein
MITVTDNLQTAMQQFSQNLNSLHKEISSANMQGKTNFLVNCISFFVYFTKRILLNVKFCLNFLKLAAQDIKKILSLTEEISVNEESSSVN